MLDFANVVLKNTAKSTVNFQNVQKCKRMALSPTVASILSCGIGRRPLNPAIRSYALGAYSRA